jgi:hypothetical protein
MRNLVETQNVETRMKFPIFVTGTLENIFVCTFFWTSLDSQIFIPYGFVWPETKHLSKLQLNHK